MEKISQYLESNDFFKIIRELPHEITIPMFDAFLSNTPVYFSSFIPFEKFLLLEFIEQFFPEAQFEYKTPVQFQAALKSFTQTKSSRSLYFISPEYSTSFNTYGQLGKIKLGYLIVSEITQNKILTSKDFSLLISKIFYDVRYFTSLIQEHLPASSKSIITKKAIDPFINEIITKYKYDPFKIPPYILLLYMKNIITIQNQTNSFQVSNEKVVQDAKYE